MPTIGVVGQLFLVAAVLHDGTGETWYAEGSVEWISSDPSVARVGLGPTYFGGPGTAELEIVGQGDVTVTVRAEGLSAAGQLMAMDEPPLSDRLVVDSFSVVELAYADSAQGEAKWYYAPVLLLRDRAGSGIDVFGVQFEIPGVGTSPYCTARRPIGAESVSLFRDVYGDYELTLDRPGYRATGEDATATLYFVDRDGKARKVLANGSVAPGSLPRTYTGGPLTDPWQCGPPWRPS